MSQGPVDLDAMDDWTPDQLTPYEKWWVQQLPFLEEAGYTFRARYQPGWEASWKATDGFFEEYEDGQFQPVSLSSSIYAIWFETDAAKRALLFDAQRVSDGAYVYMKRMSPTESKGYADELQILQYLVSEPLKSDPRNRCVPVLDVLHVPGDEGEVILVTPMLSQFYEPRFHTFGEVVAFLTQAFEVNIPTFVLVPRSTNLHIHLGCRIYA